MNKTIYFWVMLKTFFQKGIIEAGCDEAGRGCLAGPVVAAAVILPADYENELLDDSKKINKTIRAQLQDEIKKNALAWAVGEVCNKEIDNINILNASFEAMHRAVAQLSVKPELLLIDGNRFKPYQDIPHECIIKGDGQYMSIAAASILAKTHRDELMESLSKKYEMYGWQTNVGYPTSAHREALKMHGPSEYHRTSFRLLPQQLEIFPDY